MSARTYYQNVGVEQPDGMLIGNATGSLIGFHGITPCDQAAAITSPGTTVAASTATSSWAFASSTQANALTTAVDAIITALTEKGILAGGTAVTDE
jgi:hypothetical protein